MAKIAELDSLLAETLDVQATGSLALAAASVLLTVSFVAQQACGRRPLVMLAAGRIAVTIL